MTRRPMTDDERRALGWLVALIVLVVFWGGVGWAAWGVFS